VDSLAWDAAVAAAVYLADHLRGLPADRGRIEAFFTEVIQAAVEAALKEDRQRRARRDVQPSKN
jgi:hypothetical protein